jgi:hypothetical protein
MLANFFVPILDDGRPALRQFRTQYARERMSRPITPAKLAKWFTMLPQRFPNLRGRGGSFL